MILPQAIYRFPVSSWPNKFASRQTAADIAMCQRSARPKAIINQDPMKQAIIIQHVGFEDLDGFAPALADHDFDVTAYNAADHLPHDIVDCDLLIVLGGPIGAYQETAYPFLSDELNLIKQRLANGRPLMGICLGAQLIARAAGARVFPSGVKEIGFAPITLTEAGEDSCLAPFTRAPVTLHWHGDTFDLPERATHLASSELCRNQAFSIGSHVIGFQFHPEATGRHIEHWLVGHAAELAAAGINVNELRRQAEALAPGLESKAYQVMTSWLSSLED